MKKQNDRNKVAGFASNVHDASGGIRVLNRVGQNPQLKGIVREIACRDQCNTNFGKLLNGRHMDLTNVGAVAGAASIAVAPVVAAVAAPLAVIGIIGSLFDD